MALLIGDATTTYSVGNSITAGTIEAWMFTAIASGTVDTLMIRTNAVANTGVTSLILGIYDDNGSGTGPTTAAAALGQGTFSGAPPINTWVTVTGVSIPVTVGVKYWLAYLSIGATFHDSFGPGSSSIAVDSTGATRTSMVATTWGGTNAVGPLGYQGTGTAGPAVTAVLTMPTFQGAF